MDVTKLSAAINQVYVELNTVVDGEVKARSFTGLTRLNLAANALKLAESHIAAAVVRTTPKAPKAPKPAAEPKKK